MSLNLVGAKKMFFWNFSLVLQFCQSLSALTAPKGRGKRKGKTAQNNRWLRVLKPHLQIARLLISPGYEFASVERIHIHWEVTKCQNLYTIVMLQAHEVPDTDTWSPTAPEWGRDAFSLLLQRNGESEKCINLHQDSKQVGGGTRARIHTEGRLTLKVVNSSPQTWAGWAKSD